MKKGSRLEPSPTNDPLMACLKGFEPLTHGLEGRCSIQLSYRHKMERVKGIEPSRPAWKAGILPLNYTRIYHCALSDFFIIQRVPGFVNMNLDAAFRPITAIYSPFRA